MNGGLIKMEFISIDVETANTDMASICQIGVVKVVNGEVVEEWSTLVNPEEWFDPINISIHGITEEDVKDSPTLPEVFTKLSGLLNDTICVCHTHFDRVSIGKALRKYNLPEIQCRWLDSARVARRTWEECAYSGYGLKNVCNIIGFEFKHHDALEDAKAAAQIILTAMDIKGISLDDWSNRVNQPINPEVSNVSREGNPEGDLYGEVIVFTGSLYLTRSEAADLAASVGCAVGSGVTKKTTLLVVGDQDITKLAGKVKSSKHIKAVTLISKGQRLRILTETDFRDIVSNV